MRQAEHTEHAAPARGTRSGASRKLLTRKAVETTQTPASEPLEASFPPAVSAAPDGLADTPSSSSSASPAAPAQWPAAPAAWSGEDEAAFQKLLGRRKAAGYQRRGKDLSMQLLKPGAIKPNPNTVVATIVALVSERGELSRGELLAAMSSASFPHPKAQPSDQGWCQGYVAGAIRNGFLEVTDKPSAAAGEEG